MPIVVQHTSELEYDLMCSTTYTLDDLGRRLSWRAFASFVRHLDADSATWQAVNKHKSDEAMWQDVKVLPMLTALLIDEVRNMQYLYASAHSKRKVKKPKSLLPNRKKNDDKRFGQEPIRKSEFNSWWNNAERG